MNNTPQGQLLLAVDTAYRSPGVSLWRDKVLLKAAGMEFEITPEQRSRQPMDPRVEIVTDWILAFCNQIVSDLSAIDRAILEYSEWFSYGRSKGKNLDVIATTHDLTGYLLARLERYMVVELVTPEHWKGTGRAFRQEKGDHAIARAKFLVEHKEIKTSEYFQPPKTKDGWTAIALGWWAVNRVK